MPQPQMKKVWEKFTSDFSLPGFFKWEEHWLIGLPKLGWGTELAQLPFLGFSHVALAADTYGTLWSAGHYVEPMVVLLFQCLAGYIWPICLGADIDKPIRLQIWHCIFQSAWSVIYWHFDLHLFASYVSAFGSKFGWKCLLNSKPQRLGGLTRNLKQRGIKIKWRLMLLVW